jgi:hypothetical protein
VEDLRALASPEDDEEGITPTSEAVAAGKQLLLIAA